MNTKKSITLIRGCVLSLATILVLNLSGGIAVSGETPETTKVSAIQIGTTTKDDVLEMCGPPASTRISESSEHWSYSYQEDRSLDVYFDKAGGVMDYRYREGTAPILSGQESPLTAGVKPGTVHCDLCPIYCTRTVCDLNSCREEKYICQWYSCNCRGE